MKLHQVLAVEKDVKSRVSRVLSDIYKRFQADKPFNGMSRVYERKQDDGEDFPSEKTKVVFTVPEQLAEIRSLLADSFDWTATKDWANTQAKADLVVDGVTLLKGAPATFYLYLENELKNLKDEVTKLPELDPAHDWKLDKGTGTWKTDPTKTVKTAKSQKGLVLYPATPEHPAQTQLISEDITIGYWSVVKESGAIPPTEKKALLARVHKLSDAVKKAREAANQVDAPEQSVAEPILKYLFA